MKLCCIICACLVMVFSAPAGAAKFSLDAQVVEAFSADGLFTPIPLPDYARPVGFPAVYKIDYSVVANPSEFAATDLGFNFVTFSVDLTQGVTDAFQMGWNPHNPIVDANGNLPGGDGPLFFSNLDAGYSNDLHAILAGVGPPRLFNSPTDPRTQVALNGPQLIGSTFLLWDGVTPAESALGTWYLPLHRPKGPRTSVQIGVVEFGIQGSAGVYSASGPANTIYFGTSPILLNPEPTSGVLLLPFAAVALLTRNRV